MKILEFCSKYKYIIALLVFIFCLFFGENSILEKRNLSRKISDLRIELQQHKQHANNVKTQNTTLTNSSPEETEEYLRKHHNLKKDNEDVFRIVPQKTERKTKKD